MQTVMLWPRNCIALFHHSQLLNYLYFNPLFSVYECYRSVILLARNKSNYLELSNPFDLFTSVKFVLYFRDTFPQALIV